MSTKINSIIEELKSLTLLEAAELVKQIEETFNVDASSSSNTGMIMAPASTELAASSDIEEKMEFDVVLEEVPASKKIAILKIIRSITSLGLKEAKDLVESVPKTLKKAVSKQEAEEIKTKLDETGAKVTIN